MATNTVVTITCDVCKDEMSSIHKDEKTRLSVVFTTEQTEGRPTRPYLTSQDIDICNKCMQNILEGKMLFGQGAMGYNTYYFNN